VFKIHSEKGSDDALLSIKIFVENRCKSVMRIFSASDSGRVTGIELFQFLILSSAFCSLTLLAEDAPLSRPAQPTVELLPEIVASPPSRTDSDNEQSPQNAPEPQITVSDNSDSPIGWATVPECGSSGTTGGGGGIPDIVVSDTETLRSELIADGPKVIAIDGRIENLGRVKNVTNKTLVGLSNARVTGGVRITNASNVIIKNIEFAQGSNDYPDAFELSASKCVWLDHNTFRDGLDGNLDIVRGSNYVTVSWNRFYYTKAHDHMLSNLNGNSNDLPTDEGKIRVTLHHNWWGAGVQERMPRVRYGDTHIFNNYYKYEPIPNDRGQNYAIGAGQHSRLLIENNYFDGSNKPIIFVSDEGTAEVQHSGNAFVDTTGSDPVRRGSAFEPPYSYVLDSPEVAAELVRAGAGPQ